jgi:hypothetical protein
VTDPVPPRYRDYLPNGLSSGQSSDAGHTEAEFEDSTVAMPTPDGGWRAIWQGRDVVLAEFTGTRDEVVAWARQHSPRCWVYSDEIGDVERVPRRSPSE